MASKKTGLGRGLDSIFLENGEDEVSYEEGQVLKISTALVDPRSDQPRRHFDQESLAQLADSISAHGVLQPILVRESGGGRYQIIAGERRWRAAKLAGLAEIPALLLHKDELDAAEIALVENIQRQDLNPVEEANAYRALLETYGMTQEALAARIGKSRSAISNAMRLLDLPESVRAMLASGVLSPGHARTLLGLKNTALIPDLAQRVVQAGLSVRETEEAVKKMNRPVKKEAPVPQDAPRVDYVAELERRMMQNLGRKVKITTKNGKKAITLYFEDNQDLDQLLRTICGEEFMQEV